MSDPVTIEKSEVGPLCISTFCKLFSRKSLSCSILPLAVTPKTSSFDVFIGYQFFVLSKFGHGGAREHFVQKLKKNVFSLKNNFFTNFFIANNVKCSKYNEKWNRIFKPRNL